MKPFLFLGLTILALLALAGCSREADMGQAQLEQTGQTAASAADNIREEFTPQELTESIGAVPEEYFAPSDHPGQVAPITYDSRDYTDASEPAIEKTAYVYLPYTCPTAMTRRTRRPGMTFSI